MLHPMLETCRHCGTNVFPNSDRTCPQCNGHLDGAAAKQRLPNGLTSPVCPNYGQTSHQKIKPGRLIAFAKDRICDNCHTMYVPPTPLWAAVLFIAIGVMFIVGSGMDIAIHIRDEQWFFAAWKLLFIAVGIAMIRHGIRAIRHRVAR